MIQVDNQENWEDVTYQTNPNSQLITEKLVQSFLPFNAVKYLSHRNIVDKHRIGLVASSAGGIIAGAALNEEYKMFKSILLFSPFINPYNSLVESADSLSKFENFEWGDIENKLVREYIRSYSPAQNISKIRDSSTVIISILGGKDNYISNTEVIDWIEKLREKEIPAYALLDESAGHGGWNNDNNNLMFSILNYFFEMIG
ncbi:prolyl oligopeptidase family serine peptidase [Streptococcus saliviloxodontae]|uniref:Oligopeptidase B n=1 Tax=Streptococcus saliviloxodontae TaxID=1349416 RepID=A0ABS2PKE8_9STRE|nr:prolyl oligopeptidase family serine peptidase [Streptococcus saliviloxodontae]MBM7635900.1 oligopeptidase B [Streptococcus saliviloxodontae]